MLELEMRNVQFEWQLSATVVPYDSLYSIVNPDLTSSDLRLQECIWKISIHGETLQVQSRAECVRSATMESGLTMFQFLMVSNPAKYFVNDHPNNVSLRWAKASNYILK